MKFQRWTMVVLAMAFALRLYQVSVVSLRADEASNLFFASQELNSIVRQLTTDDPHAPLYFFILHYWVAWAGNSELALRILGVFAGTLMVALVYLLGKILLPAEPRVALTAAALAAINPSLIWDAQDAHLYPFLVLFCTASFVTFLLATRSSSPVRWFAYIAASALALYFHYIAAFILFAQGAIMLVAFRRRFFHWLIAQVFIAAMFLPWFLLAGNLLRGYQLDFFPPANVFEILMRSLQAFTVGRVDARIMPPMVEPGIGTIAAIGFLAIFLIGLWSYRAEKLSLGILLAYIFIPLICFEAYGVFRFSIYDERYVFYLVPAFLLIVARGINVGLPKRTIWLGATTLFIVGASAHSLYDYWYVPAFAKSPDWRGFAQTLLADVQPGDVLIQNYPDPALPYYLQNRIPRVLLPRSSAQNANDLNADLVRLVAKYNRVWFQPAPGSTWDTEGLVAQWFSQNARLIDDYEFNGARLELYVPVPGPGAKP